MKKIINLITLLIISYTGYTQTYDKPANYGLQYKRVKVDTAFNTPNANIGDTVKVTLANRKAGSIAYSTVLKKFIYSSDGHTYDSTITVSSGIGLDQVLAAGNTATNKRIKIINNNYSIPNDSFVIDLQTRGRYKGIRIQNSQDTSGGGALGTSELAVLNYQGKGWHLRTYNIGVPGYGALHFDGDSAGIIQMNGTDLILEKSVNHGYDAFGYFDHTNRSFNISNSLTNQMAYSFWNNNLYVDGNAKFNQATMWNDTGRGAHYMFMAPLNNGPVTGPVGLKIITIGNDSTKKESFNLRGGGDLFILNSFTVGSIATGANPAGTLNVKVDDLSGKPLVYLDDESNTKNYMELWGYFNNRKAYIDYLAYQHFPKYFITNPGTASRVDSSLTLDASTREVVMTKNLVYSMNQSVTGSINSSNTVFTLPYSSTTSNVAVYYNGLRLNPTVDYVVSGATLTFTVAPTTLSTILTDILH